MAETTAGQTRDSVHVTERTFGREVLAPSVPVLVDVYVKKASYAATSLGVSVTWQPSAASWFRARRWRRRRRLSSRGTAAGWL